MISRPRALCGAGLVVFAAALVFFAPLSYSDSVGLQNRGAPASPDPNIICCGYVNISNVNVQVTSSNLNSNNTATISFSTSPTGSDSTVYWGLNATYSGYESGKEDIGTNHQIVIHYMNPGTTFYFSIISRYSQPGVEWYPAEYKGNFSTPATPNYAWHTGTVRGYVLTASGLPFSSAWTVSVTGYYSDGASGCSSFPWPAAATVAPNGSYSISAWIVVTTPPIGTCYLTGWNASGYNNDGGKPLWTETWTLPGNEPNNATGWNWQTFYLDTPTLSNITQSNPDGGQNGVYAAMAFVDTTNAGCAVNSGYSISSSVYAYVGGNGFTYTHGFNLSQTFPGGGSTSDYGESPGIANQYYFTGIYAMAPSGGIQLTNFTSVNSAGIINDVFYNGADPVSTPPAANIQTSPIISVPPNTTSVISVNAYGSMTLQFGVDVTVGFSAGLIVTVSVSTNIQFGISGTQSTFSGVTCTIGSSHHNSTQYFEFYEQGGTNYYQGVETHVWQCKPTSNGGQPSSCTPINQP